MRVLLKKEDGTPYNPAIATSKCYCIRTHLSLSVFLINPGKHAATFLDLDAPMLS